ncbi:MAG: hypothetical protein IJS62_05555 [Bacteroidales bacterium]|nr:hypothetical protein [Bacteroidales bacterium]
MKKIPESKPYVPPVVAVYAYHRMASVVCMSATVSTSVEDMSETEYDWEF